MNEFLILLILKIAPSNIYEIKKFIDTKFAPFLQVSVGAIVPALKRLEKVNAVKAEKEMTQGGLRKSIYYILPNGEEIFNAYLKEPIICAPQIARRETEILLLLTDIQGLHTDEPIFTPEQYKLLIEKTLTSLNNTAKIIEKELNGTNINAEILNLELVYTEAKIRYLKELMEEEHTPSPDGG